MRAAVIVAFALTASAGVVSAYPQFQLSKDQTCTDCHVDPAGGWLLNENGLSTAQSLGTYDVAPEAAHGALVGPSWLEVGAELRAGAGFVDARGPGAAAYPMQADAEALVRGDGFTLFGTLGPQQGSSAASDIASREHWLMWQPDQSATDGLYLRVGRFEPVFGLRLAEHTAYTEQYGGAQLYGEAYGAAVEYVKPDWEAHVTAFVHDPIQDSVEKGDGAALYSELRVTKAASIGVEGRYANSDTDTRWDGGATAKYWIAPAEVLLEAEGQVIRQSFTAGTARTQVVSYLLASWFLHQGWMLDVGAGQYDEDLNVKDVELEGVDVNLHWFASSHWELMMTNRIQTIALGGGGPTSGWALLQFHYRL
jgi:hypothetical protein